LRASTVTRQEVFQNLTGAALIDKISALEDWALTLAESEAKEMENGVTDRVQLALDALEALDTEGHAKKE